MYTDDEQNVEWLKENWLPTLDDDELAKRIDGLYSYDKIVTVAELHAATTTPRIALAWGAFVKELDHDLAGRDFALPPIRIESSGTGHKAVRNASREELLGHILTNESTRRWSANNAEQKSLDKLAAEEAERQLKDAAAGRDKFADINTGYGAPEGVYIETNPNTEAE